MDYSEVFLRQHDEVCQVVGSIVFSLVEAGHDSTSENIVAVLRNGIAESRKWEPDQVLYLQLAIDLLERGRGVPGALTPRNCGSLTRGASGGAAPEDGRYRQCRRNVVA
jgi:nitrogen-specific signal transduction histidine kinase